MRFVYIIIALTIVGCSFDRDNNAFVKVDKESVIVASLLHDVCKLKGYEKTENGFKKKNLNEFGHGSKSVEIIKQYIDLSTQEENMIRFHMGFYGTTNFSSKFGEYSLMRLVEEYRKDLAVELFHYADNMVAKFVDKRWHN